MKRLLKILVFHLCFIGSIYAQDESAVFFAKTQEQVNAAYESIKSLKTVTFNPVAKPSVLVKAVEECRKLNDYFQSFSEGSGKHTTGDLEEILSGVPKFLTNAEKEEYIISKINRNSFKIRGAVDIELYPKGSFGYNEETNMFSIRTNRAPLPVKIYWTKKQMESFDDYIELAKEKNRYFSIKYSVRSVDIIKNRYRISDNRATEFIAIMIENVVIDDAVRLQDIREKYKTEKGTFENAIDDVKSVLKSGQDLKQGILQLRRYYLRNSDKYLSYRNYEKAYINALLAISLGERGYSALENSLVSSIKLNVLELFYVPKSMYGDGFSKRRTYGEPYLDKLSELLTKSSDLKRYDQYLQSANLPSFKFFTTCALYYGGEEIKNNYKIIRSIRYPNLPESERLKGSGQALKYVEKSSVLYDKLVAYARRERLKYQDLLNVENSYVYTMFSGSWHGLMNDMPDLSIKYGRKIRLSSRCAMINVAHAYVMKGEDERALSTYKEYGPKCGTDVQKDVETFRRMGKDYPIFKKVLKAVY